METVFKPNTGCDENIEEAVDNRGSLGSFTVLTTCARERQVTDTQGPNRSHCSLKN